jgi:glycosyltransferase involved in cell wall biosynthesis
VKVLFLKEALVLGGAERQLALLMRYLPEEWESRVWTLGGGPFVDVIVGQGQRVDVRPRATRFDVRPAFHLWRLIWEWRPDVVHSWDRMSSAAALPLCRALGIPLLDATIRVGFLDPRRRAIRGVCMHLSARVIANSVAGLSAWGISRAKGRVVYNGFDPERLVLCDGGGSKPNTPTVVTMTGRMSRQKDFSTMIRAARLLAADCPQDWRFILMGSGTERPRLMAEADDLVRQGVVAFVDAGLEVLPSVSAAHIGVLMTDEHVHMEGCANSIMEYMACGLPVVCTRGGGNAELVVEGETGYLIGAGDHRLLVDRLRELAGDPELAERMGRRGRGRLLGLFTVERMVAGTLGVYREVLRR